MKQATRKEKRSIREQQQSEIVHEKSNRNIFQEYTEAFVVAVILAILIRAIFFQAFKIPSGSMEPTLLIGDHILVNKLVYGIRIPFTEARWPQFYFPERGDVIVFVFPDDRTKDYIKRVVAVGGDTVEIRNKKVILNGQEIEDPHAYHGDRNVVPKKVRDEMDPITVPSGYLFVMGDNRDYSYDSRFWSFVPVSDVKGEAFLIYYSSRAFWERVFHIIR